MILTNITVPSFWVPDLKQKHYKLQENNAKLVVMFPGKNYSCDKPCLHYAVTSSFQSGYDVLVLEYGYQAARTELDISDLPKIMDESEEAIKRIVSDYEQVVFISKSLGTIIAGEVHRRLSIPVKHIYLTPIKATIDYINSSDGIVIYGTNDEVFNKELANQIMNNKVIEIADANHSLETNDVKESIAILQNLVSIYKEFLNT